MWAVFGIPRDEFMDYPITEFQLLCNQAVNISGFWATGDLQTQTQKDEIDLLKAQYKELKRKGLL